MPELLAAVTDLAPVDGDAGGVPRLPELESLLARGRRRSAPSDWRRWALAQLGVEPPPGDLPVGASVAAAAGLHAPGTWLLATPVHLYPTLTHVRQHAAGPLPIDAPEASALTERFRRDLAEPGVALHVAGERLLVHFAEPLVVTTHDPAPWAGRDVAPAEPSGPDAGRISRLATEIQMWLHGRAATGGDRVPCNALWLWGAGSARVAACRWPELASDDVLLRALHVLDGARVDDPARRLATWRLAALGAAGDAFGAADAQWFAPLARELARGRWSRARVWFAGHEFELTPRTRWRLWVKARPWWELAA